MTAGASMLTITRSFPPHCRQVSISIANTRLRRCAHDIARCRSLTGTSPRSMEAAERVLGTRMQLRPADTALPSLTELNSGASILYADFFFPGGGSIAFGALVGFVAGRTLMKC